MQVIYEAGSSDSSNGYCSEGRTGNAVKESQNEIEEFKNFDRINLSDLEENTLDGELEEFELNDKRIFQLEYELQKKDTKSI